MGKEAILEFEKALGIDPNHVNAQKYLDIAKERLKKKEVIRERAAKNKPVEGTKYDSVYAHLKNLLENQSGSSYSSKRSKKHKKKRSKKRKSESYRRMSERANRKSWMDSDSDSGEYKRGRSNSRERLSSSRSPRTKRRRCSSRSQSPL
eukprot:CAMPEP_0168536134 /NCGR_PEP_ID=MMETSP0405-20121227/19300_1 /TAXON_ID=498012 /ORGANISM="Trichosphaerium sp, Strain Am-I-7 wt" /LENGTH=148 /DNA_ID=CAMNT_0008563945 /DNA_START=386 /DNA_END=832 /DNA_ORIENTATION=-